SQLKVLPHEAEPHGLPGYYLVSDPEVRARRTLLDQDQQKTAAAEPVYYHGTDRRSEGDRIEPGHPRQWDAIDPAGQDAYDSRRYSYATTDLATAWAHAGQPGGTGSYWSPPKEVRVRPTVPVERDPEDHGEHPSMFIAEHPWEVTGYEPSLAPEAWEGLTREHRHTKTAAAGPRKDARYWDGQLSGLEEGIHALPSTPSSRAAIGQHLDGRGLDPQNPLRGVLQYNVIGTHKLIHVGPQGIDAGIDYTHDPGTRSHMHHLTLNDVRVLPQRQGIGSAMLTDLARRHPDATSMGVY